MSDGLMPVISLWQPFASLIFEWDEWRGDFVKAHETRGFKLPARLIGADVAIHATASFPARRFISSALNDLCYDRFGCGYNHSLPFGAIIGIVRFGEPKPTSELRAYQCDDEKAAGDWSEGRWAWPIMSAERLTVPVPAKGKQGWWRYPARDLYLPKGRAA